jgi:hypothetical protein
MVWVPDWEKESSDKITDERRADACATTGVNIPAPRIAVGRELVGKAYAAIATRRLPRRTVFPGLRSIQRGSGYNVAVIAGPRFESWRVHSGSA